MTAIINGLGYVAPPDEIIINPDGSLNAASVRALFETVDNLVRNYNGQISLGDTSSGSQAGNVNAVYANATSPGANVEFAVKHELGRIPVGYDIVSRDKGAVIYDSRRYSWTPSTIFLKSSIATTTIRLRIY
jgi:hypothetical protein